MTLRFVTKEITKFEVVDTMTNMTFEFTEGQWSTADLLVATHPRLEEVTANAKFLTQFFDLQSYSADILAKSHYELVQLNGV